MQRLLLKQLNVNVRYNNNAPVHLNDCIEGLLHLGLNVITFMTLLHLGQLLHLGLQQFFVRLDTRYDSTKCARTIQDSRTPERRFLEIL